MKSETAERHRDRVRSVLPYIAARVGCGADRLSLDELSGVALTAPCYFHRIFHAATGEPVHRYVRRLRLDYAAYRLLVGDRPIVEIAFDAGYESHAAFTRAFKQAFSCPPAEFRGKPRSAPLTRGPPDALRTTSAAHARVAFVRHTGSYAEIPASWERLRRLLTSDGLPAWSVDAIGIAHDPPEVAFGGDFRYDACVVVPDRFRPPAGVRVQLVPALETIAAPHDGVRDLLVYTYVRLVVEWARRGDGRALRRFPYYEHFRHFPHMLDPHEVHAELHVGLERPARGPSPAWAARGRGLPGLPVGRAAVVPAER